MNVWNTSPLSPTSPYSTSPKPQPHLLPSITIMSVLIGYNEPLIKTVLFRINNNIENTINTSTLVTMTSVFIWSSNETDVSSLHTLERHHFKNHSIARCIEHFPLSLTSPSSTSPKPQPHLLPPYSSHLSPLSPYHRRSFPRPLTLPSLPPLSLSLTTHQCYQFTPKLNNTRDRERWRRKGWGWARG